MLIPPDRLHPHTLLALIEEFVTRDGAVHGHCDVPLPRQIDTVRHQLKTGAVVIVFDEENQTCTLLPREQWAGPSNGAPPRR